MREIVVLEKKYGLKEWHDLTLREASTILDVPIPGRLADYLNDGKEMDFTPSEELSEFPRYYVEIILLLTTIPREVFAPVRFGYFNQVRYITEFFFHHCLPYLLALKHAPDYEPLNIPDFEFKGEIYVVPPSRKIADMLIPFADEKAITFVESTQLMGAIFESKSIGLGNMALVTAILCRKENEAYNEQVALQRATEFMDLTMDIIWEVFFCIINGLAMSNRRISMLFGVATALLRQTEQP